MISSRWNAVILAALFLGLPALARAAEDGELIRKIAETNGDAVVTIQLVLEMSMSYGGSNEKEERKISAPGTIIDPSGLVVSSLSEVDPVKAFSEFMAEDAESRVSSNIVDAKIRTNDGEEIPADLVLRDRDLDLAFLRPKKAPTAPMKFVDLSQACTPQLTDEVAILYRLGPAANRSLAVRVERIQSVVTKPRTFYVIDGERFGCPAFGMDGKPAGIVTLRTGQGDGRSIGMYSMSRDMLMVVLPCSTVAKAAEQAKTAEPEKPEVPAAKPAAKPAPKATPKPAPKAPAKGK